ncbi:MAG: alkaline phosphatase [Lacunisphaera sp.]|nr:alkaline phosphatase [Lacunisphaera sp.]
MIKAPLFLLALLAATAAAAGTARNVILFIGDAGGIPTLHAASIHGHGQPQALFIQHLPHLGLMDTSAADAWVTDSAAGMSAIVTGQKTNNGVLSQSAAAVKDQRDGETLQTILEHAEQRGLSTGVITNMSIADATPAACYAHANYRKKTGEIFAQLAQPRFGDGVDIVIGAGRKAVLAGTRELGIDIEARLRTQGYVVLDSPAALSAEAPRVAALTDDGDFDPRPVVARAIEILSRNPKGYFLMVEWDMHPTKLRRGLDRVLQMDDIVRQTAAQVKDDTLIIFTADHSFDLRTRGGKPGEPLLPAEPAASAPAAKPNVRVDDGHTGEQVLVAAQGPGAEKVHGFIKNTDLFHVMMSAYGWTAAAP